MPAWFRRELSLGDEGSDVLIVRAKLGMGSGPYNADLLAKLSGWCEARTLPFRGVLDYGIAEALGEDAAYGLTPTWWGDDTRAAERLGVDVSDLETAVRQWQSSQGITPTGVLTEDQARLIGE